MKAFPPIPDGNSIQNIITWLRGISQLRNAEDINEFNSLPQRYVLGRLRNRTAPSAFNDVTPADRLGDIVRDGSYEYIVVNDAGTLKWARIALDVSW